MNAWVVPVLVVGFVVAEVGLAVLIGQLLHLGGGTNYSPAAQVERGGASLATGVGPAAAPAGSGRATSIPN